MLNTNLKLPCSPRKSKDWTQFWRKRTWILITFLERSTRSTRWTGRSDHSNRRSKSLSTKTTQLRRRWGQPNRTCDCLPTKTLKSWKSSTSTSRRSSKTTNKTRPWRPRSTSWSLKMSTLGNKLRMLRSHSDYPVPLRPNCKDSSMNTKAESIKIINNLIHTGRKYKNLSRRTVPLESRCVEPRKISGCPQALSTSSLTSSKLLATRMNN